MRIGCLLLLVITLCFDTASRSQSREAHTSLIETIAGGEAAGVPGPEFSFASVAGLAADAYGNTYFTLQYMNRVYRLGIDGHVTVYAGNGVRGNNVDGVPAVESPLLNPYALTVDATGNLYLTCSHALLRVDALTGVLSTVFTTPYAPPGSSSTILGIQGMTAGPDGALYFTDGGDWRVKRYSFASGAVTILAGNGMVGDAQPGVSAISSPLKHPQAPAVGSDGTIYFSSMEPKVFRIRPSGGKLEALDIRVAREGPPLGEYDIPSDIALDDAGHLFIAQANRSQVLRVVLKSGDVSVFAGTGDQHFNGDGIGPAHATVTPGHIAWDHAGNLTIAEPSRIRRIERDTGLITTVVGNGLSVSDDARTSALHAKLWEPANVAIAPDGSIYITSSFSNRLLHLSRDGRLASVAGGGDFTVTGSEPGLPSQVSLYFPQGIWIDTDGEIYFSDYDNRIIRRMAANVAEVQNFATTPKNSHSSGLFLYYTASLVADERYFYLSDPNGYRVWRVSRSDGAVEPFAGTGSPAHIVDGFDPSGALAAPSGLVLDSSGNLYIADGYLEGKAGRILRLDATTGGIATILSGLRQPSGLAFKSPGTLCFSEAAANQVSCLDLADHRLSLVAGTGAAGFSGDGGPAECARLNRPSGISFDPMGNLYIADTGNQRVRKVRLGKSLVRCHD
jgi:sugar lactone lactonase YvrE